LDYFQFCELGVVSPDYPYLAIGDNSAEKWADLMHYKNTTLIIKFGIEEIRKLQGEEQRKAFAWLLGYASHVATDVTIHPVVELKVGPYAQNKTDHRICEMHQDAHIFQRLNLGGVGLSNHLSSGIGACSNENGKGLDQTICKLWSGLLNQAYPEDYQLNFPDMDKWHDRFEPIVECISEAGNMC
jgi:hypothetical protein